MSIPGSLRFTCNVAVADCNLVTCVNLVDTLFAGLARLIKLYEFFNNEHHELTVDMRRVDDVSDAYEMLRKLDRSALTDEGDVMRIVLDLSSMEAYRAILRQVFVKLTYKSFYRISGRAIHLSSV